MTKNLLNLLASSASLVAMLVMTYAVNAAPIKDQPVNPIISVSTLESVNLNFAPMLNLTVQANNPILNHFLGCSCAVCMKSSLPSEK